MEQNQKVSRRLILKRKAFLIAVGAALLALPVFFQNCGKMLPESADLASVSANAPFAFEAQVDQIAYMSCSNMPSGYDTSAFFTFKAGAYTDSGGIKFNSEFKYAARNLTGDDKARALSQSDANRDVILALSLRKSAELQKVFSTGSLYAGDFLGNLTVNAIASVLAKKNGNSYANDFPLLGANSRLADNIHFTSSEAVAAQVRAELNTNGNYLAVTFNRAGADAAQALGPTSGSQTSVYGKGLKLQHGLGFGQSTGFSTGPVRILASVNEYNLIDGQPSSAIWDCHPEWRFMIIQPSDLGVKAVCPNHDQDIAPTAGQAEMHTVLRRMLPFSDWGVNLAYRCVVPKKTGSCYGNGATNVNYSGGTCDPATGTCPHYVSICKRRAS